MLSSSMLKEEVEVIVDLVSQKKTEDAKQRLNHLVPEVSSEYGRGALLALNGILNVLETKNSERMSDYDKILRAVERIPRMQTIDDMDKGYLQTMSKWAKKSKIAAKEKAAAKDKADAKESESAAAKEKAAAKGKIVAKEPDNAAQQ
jgi:hypothetical protein